jgi:hypothetical protein
MQSMSTQTTEVEPAANPAISPAIGPAIKPAVSAPLPDPENDLAGSDNPIGMARGIANAVMISIPFWVLFGFMVYLLL